MRQFKNKKKIYFYLLLLVFLSSIFNQNLKSKLSDLFLINKIKVSGIDKYEKKMILNELEKNYNLNIFLINKDKIIRQLSNLTFIEELKIKKKLPSQVNVSAKKTELLAIIYFDGEKYYVGNNKKLINPKDIKNINGLKLPIVFGNVTVEEFMKLLSILKKKKLNINEIKRFHYFPSKRWDLSFDNGIILRLPSENIEKALKNFIIFKKNNNLINNTSIDLRISDRIIVSND